MSTAAGSTSIQSTKQLTEQVNIPWDPNISFKAWCSSAGKLLDQARLDEKDGNLEASFINYFKFTSIMIEYLPKHREYVKMKSTPQFLENSKHLNEAMTILEVLKKTLDKQYKDRAAVAASKVLATSKEASTSKIAPPNPIQKNVQSSKSNNRKSILDAMGPTISASTLRDILINKNFSLLLIDLRRNFTNPQNRAENIHLLGPVIRFDPSRVTKSIQSSELENMLTPSMRSLFDMRDHVDIIVYFDEESTVMATLPLPHLVSAIYDFEFKKVPVSIPKFLVGGLNALYSIFPEGFLRDSSMPSNPNLASSNRNSGTVSNVGLLVDTSDSWLSDGLRRLSTEDNGARSSPFDNPYLNFQPVLSKSNSLIGDAGILQNDSSVNSFGAISKTLIDFSSGSTAYPIVSAHFEPAAKVPIAPPVLKAPLVPTSISYAVPPPIPVKPNSIISNNEAAKGYPVMGLKPPELPKKPSVMINNNSMDGHGSRSKENSPIEPNPFASLHASMELIPSGSYGTNLGCTGLKNLGNTCFMNSTLQCLSAAAPLRRYFLDGTYKRHINRTNKLGTKGVLSESYAALQKALWSTDFTVVAPVEFKEAIGRFTDRFQGYDQQDAQEFLSFLLDGIHEDLKLISAIPANIVDPDDDKIPDDHKLGEILWKNYVKRNQSVIVNYFQGQYRSKLCCTVCQKTSTTFNSIMYLSVEIPQKRGPNSYLNVYNCIDQFTSIEILDKDDAWYCSRCKCHRRAQKKIDLWRLPPILLIHFKRFSFNGPFRDKLDLPIDFPISGLDLSRYCPPGDKKPIYDLFAVTNHFGGLSGGHYTSFCYNGNKGMWYNFDDSRVTPIGEGDLKTKAAYILYYVRRTNS